MAHNQIQAQGQVKKGKAGEKNTFVITSKTDFEGALGGIVVAFDGVDKPKLDFEYESDRVIVNYWPSLPGEYRLEITKGGFDIPGSPFKCIVDPSHSPIPEKITVSGEAFTKCFMSRGNIITVDTTQAHIVGVTLKAYMSGKTFPMRKYGKPDIYVSEDVPGMHEVKIVPKFAGTYKLFLEFDKIKVPGSPFVINAEDPSAPNAPPEKWPVKIKPKKVLFSTPRAQQVSITVTPCQ